jgi:hypothetical protein
VTRFLAINIEGKIGQLTVRRTSSFINSMKRMRKCNDEVYQLAKDQGLVKKLKHKRFRPNW